MLHRRVRAGLVLLLSIFAIVSATGSDTAWSQSAINPSVNDQAVTPHASCTSLEACGVNFRLAPGASPPPGARRLFDDIYTLPPSSPTSDGPTKADLSARALWVEDDIAIQLDLPIPSGPILPQSDPLMPQQYSLGRMDVYEVWDAGAIGQGVTVAVVDSGVDFTHPDLAGVFVSRGRDFINNDDDATDDHGHGTHVTGIIAMRPDNGVGGAGVAYGARILPVKAMSANGGGGAALISEGIAWAADQGAKIINLSLGSLYPSQTLEAAVTYATNKGALVVAAAGNHGAATPMYPAAYPQALSVCATDHGDRRASFSGYGPSVDVCAPGADIVSTVRGGGWQTWDGTSMAAPAASAVAALIWSRYPTWDAQAVRAALLAGAEPVVDVGAGRVNAARAIGASAPTPQPQPTPASGDYAAEIVALINQTRQANGLAALRYDARLKAAADAHNRWMRDHNCFAHDCPGEPTVMQRMRNAGYPVISGGENIGAGFGAPADMLAGWMGSAGHKAAILNPYWPDIGCGYLADGALWSCEFARTSDYVPIPTTQPLPTRTPTPTPVSRPPMPTAQPMPTVRPPSPPSEYTMIIRLPYRGLSWSETDWLYRTLCVGWAVKGVTCQWVRE